MAEGTFVEIAERIIGQLGNLALQEVGLLWGLKDELEKLMNTVSTIKAVVQDAEEHQAQSHAIKDWVAKLTDVLFEADDLLEELSNEALQREVMTQNKKAKEVCISFPKLNQLSYDFKMGHKIKAIRKKLYAIAEDMKEFHLEVRPREIQVTNPMRETDYFARAETVIGREHDKKVIIERLLDSNIEENVSVYSIVGLGGLGKTTLAQLVFNDEEIEKEFERKFWVCVSDDFDVKIIVKKFLEYANCEKLENLERNAAINELQKEIDGKKFLLVLDDVWNDDSEKWDSLKEILQGGARGSRILVTTREEKVAESSKTIDTHHLTGLNDEDSWSLFKQRAFKKGQEPENAKFKEIGMEIVSKCKGVPLAIFTIGSLLYLKKSEEEWLSFKNHEFSKVNKNDFLPTLKLSYDRLPSHLKQCFAYCALFPKDYLIKKEELIKLWMAQGFIKRSRQNQCLEDIGHEYFLELLSRSLFQEVEEDEWGNISFKIHGLMHDLLLVVAGKESIILHINEENINEETRHLSFAFHLGSSSLTTQLFQTSSLRTFLLCGQQSGKHDNGLNESNFVEIVSHFKVLRVLDFHKTGIKTVPSSISRLNHLRYLDLSDNKLIEMLPKSLSLLRNLQMLKLSGCVRLKELPRDISKLVSLRSLEIDGCRDLTHMPCGLGQLTNLQTLSQFVISKDTSSVSRNNGELEELNQLNAELKELNTLTNLRGTLEIVNLRDGKDAEAEFEATNLEGIKNLQALGLRGIEDEVDKEDVVFDETLLEALQPHPNLKLLSLYRYMGVGFPNWLSSLTNLVEFTLFGCKKCQHLPLLYQFPSLKVLELDSLSALEYISHSEEFSNSSFFLSLEELKIKYCPKLKGWWQRGESIEEVNDDDDNSIGIATTRTSMAGNHIPPSFSSLSKLCIWACPKLVSMPSFPFLVNLELYYCSFTLLEETTKIAAAEVTVVASASSSTHATSSFAPLSKLKSIEIGRMEEPLPEECMQNLISLDRLWIYECRGPLLQGMRHLTALKQLEICSSELFDLSNDGMEWKGLRRLNSLWLFQLLKLESLPEGIQHVTSLRKLTIDYCPCLTALPEWIFSLTSLEILEILQCPKLRSLPVEISRLTSLQTLKIHYCPILSQRCKKEIGRDWPQICHIKNLDLEPGNSDGEPNEQQKKLDLLRIRT